MPPITLRRPDSAGQASRLLAGLGFPADTVALAGAVIADFAARAGSCAEQTAADCTPLPDGECSAEYLRHLVAVHARRTLGEAFVIAAA